MNILLISGHGEGDPGAVAKIDGYQYKEADLTVDLVKRIYEKLGRYNVGVNVYDYNKDAYQAYKRGTLSFSKADTDYILEIHFNACVKDYSGNGKTTGTEIYYPSRGIMSGLEENMLKHISKLGLKNRGVFQKQLAVINTAARAGIPANLLEVCFIDDADDLRLYLGNVDLFAQEITNAIAEYFHLEKRTENKPWWEVSGEWADATRLGLVDGSRPTAYATRAEVAAVAVRVIDYIMYQIKEVEKL